MAPPRLPLFPLNVVLLPGTDMPLHIFEPRYRQMVRECLETRTAFGMLLALPKGIAGTGCTAEILEVTKRYEDGRCDILAIGRDPFRVTQLFTDDPLLQGDVDFLEDQAGPVPRQITRDLQELYETCHTLVFGDYPRNIREDSPIELSYRIAGTLPMELRWKQSILELRSEAERQERLVMYLKEWAPFLQRAEDSRAGAAGTGSVN
ncbi:MAG TPA: LON peptidase substrate-binding domain-containing protein [Dongiaceae bacterium]|nr:LON peptidase substrate-binding domain-containing protein [Dongiaceae bacterium]